ncbi:2'-5' RNA ligase family protein [Ferrimicrobium sp.]|uniref:2'-5' RNA ligase family protein n=1 Tax=Ferrimicrobium sp. TaxID=2926050 RepID=UPI0026301CD0|nr:2'-5' RNA ligase family protein [Ferrimicrobium sp.]
MAPRVRCCVAVTFADPVAVELDVVRRVLGSRSIDWIVPHITLVPPVDCTPAEAWEWVGRIGAFCTRTAPVDLELQGFATFANRRITGHLPVRVGQEDLERWHGQLTVARSSRSYIPHVTVVENLDSETSSILEHQLSTYELGVRADEVTLLVAQVRGQRREWRPFLRALVGFGGMRRRAHRSVRAVLSRSSPVAHSLRCSQVSCWLMDETGELLGWVEAINGPNGVWVLNAPVLLDSDLVGFGFEELVVGELLDYLSPSTVVARSQVEILDAFGAEPLSLEGARLLGLHRFALTTVGSSAVEDPHTIKWKFLSFSTR